MVVDPHRPIPKQHRRSRKIGSPTGKQLRQMKLQFLKNKPGFVNCYQKVAMLPASPSALKHDPRKRLRKSTSNKLPNIHSKTSVLQESNNVDDQDPLNRSRSHELKRFRCLRKNVRRHDRNQRYKKTQLFLDARPKTTYHRPTTPLLFDKTCGKVYAGCPSKPRNSDIRKKFPSRPPSHQSYRRANFIHNLKYQEHMHMEPPRTAHITQRNTESREFQY